MAIFRRLCFSLILVALIGFTVNTAGCAPITEVKDRVSEYFGDDKDNDEEEPATYETFSVFYDKQPPYSRTPSEDHIHLVNNKEAIHPTWQQLMSFLRSDKTDQKAYNLSSYPCGAFAEELHNNAEAAGIRAAWVGVGHMDDSNGHALNAFHTTDRGLVFVDCTSSFRSDVAYTPIFDVDTGEVIERVKLQSYDKIAYVEIGKEYGVMSAEVATSPEYSFYRDYVTKREQLKIDIEDFNRALDTYNVKVEACNREIDAYNRELEAYEREVEEYNQALGGRTELKEPEYSQFKEWVGRLKDNLAKLENTRAELNRSQAQLDGVHAQLKNIQADLEAVKHEIGDFHWFPLGVVSNIEIYW